MAGGKNKPSHAALLELNMTKKCCLPTANEGLCVDSICSCCHFFEANLRVCHKEEQDVEGEAEPEETKTKQTKYLCNFVLFVDYAKYNLV